MLKLYCYRVRESRPDRQAGVSEWQTMQTQNLLRVTACGFKSRSRQ